MVKMFKKSKMTIDKLARMTQGEFKVVREEMQSGFKSIHEEMATKDDLKLLKDDIIDEVRNENHKVIVSNDGVASKLDDLLKDRAADKLLHNRHERRLEKLEVKIR